MNDSVLHLPTIGSELEPIGLATGYLWSRTTMVNELLQILHELDTWPGAQVATCPNGLSLRVDGARFGHVDWNGRICLPVPLEIRDRLVAERMADLDPDDLRCVVFRIRTMAEVRLALWLLRLGYRLRRKPTVPTPIPITVSLGVERELHNPEASGR
ncbi:MAG TPA: luciferase family protein [Phycisphaerae bacterium]|nr:luciferase family protein [Phycisphaerae bacterium]